VKDFVGERVLMRIHIGEGDEYHGKHLHSAILDVLRQRGCAGATVFRGAMSYGSKGVVHTDAIEVMSLNLPIIVECVDSQEKIDEILPELDEMVHGGLITLERVEVITYREHEPQ
jgi:PII-like signaling protein